MYTFTDIFLELQNDDMLVYVSDCCR